MSDKTCYKCKRALPLSAFFKDRSRPDGLSYICRECRCAANRARYVQRPRKPHGWLKPTRDGDKKQARRRINYLVEQGRIPHPDDLPCFDCMDGVYGPRFRHEYDHARGYDGENQLYVEAVCSRCHHNREDYRRAWKD